MKMCKSNKPFRDKPASLFGCSLSRSRSYSTGTNDSGFQSWSCCTAILCPASVTISSVAIVYWYFFFDRGFRVVKLVADGSDGIHICPVVIWSAEFVFPPATGRMRAAACVMTGINLSMKYLNKTYVTDTCSIAQPLIKSYCGYDKLARVHNMHQYPLF